MEHMTTRKTAAKETLTVRITSAQRRKLERLAKARKLGCDALAAEALDHYLESEEYRIEQIKEGFLRQANAGALVRQEEIAAWVASWSEAHEHPLPEIR